MSSGSMKLIFIPEEALENAASKYDIISLKLHKRALFAYCSVCIIVIDLFFTKTLCPVLNLLRISNWNVFSFY